MHAMGMFRDNKMLTVSSLVASFLLPHQQVYSDSCGSTQRQPCPGRHIIKHPINNLMSIFTLILLHVVGSKTADYVDYEQMTQK